MTQPSPQFLFSFLRIALKFARKNILMCIALAGLIFGIGFSFTYGNPPINPPNQLALPPSSPFEKNISGIGFVEANTENVNLGAFSTGIVEQVFVKAGDKVKKGMILFTLDRRTALTDITLKETTIRSMEADVEAGKVDVEEKKSELHRARGLTVGKAITEREVQKRGFDLRRSQAQLMLKTSQLDKAKADLASAKVTLDKLSVLAPFDGTIFKVRVRPGELISEFSASQQQAPIVMGNIQPYHMRVQIDENDIWRFEPKAKAYAYLKSNKDIKLPLTFIRLDPYAQTKQSLSGDSAEKVDTRIVEVVYKVEGQPKGIFVGQQFDVFMECVNQGKN